MFQDHINRLGKLEKGEAMRRLRILVCSVMLRRPIGTTVALPERKDLVHRLDFSAAEQKLYDLMKEGALSPPSGSVSSQPNALICINNLRQICNLGIYAQTKSPSAVDQSWNARTAQEAFNSLVTMGSAVCAICQATLEFVGAEVADQTSGAAQAFQPYLYSCLFLICGHCRETIGRSCSHQLKHPSEAVTTLASSGTSISTPELDGTDQPTKIRAVLDDLSTHTRTVKWYVGHLLISDAGVPLTNRSVVFSFWVTTLNFIEKGLKDRGIEYIRFDGKVSNARRIKVLKSFREDPSVRVALLTISCGAVG